MALTAFSALGRTWSLITLIITCFHHGANVCRILLFYLFSDFPDDIVLPSLQRGVRSFENGDQESDPDEPRQYKRRGQRKPIYRRGLKSKDRRLSHSLDDIAKVWIDLQHGYIL